MKKLPITSITLGLDVRDMEYGAGNGRFIHLRSDVQDGIPGLDLDEALNQSLDMLGQAWKTIISARYSDRSIDVDTMRKSLKVTLGRIERMREFIMEKRYDEQTEN